MTRPGGEGGECRVKSDVESEPPADCVHAMQMHGWMSPEWHALAVRRELDLKAELAALRAENGRLRAALETVQREAQGCQPHCTHEFHQWGIASVLRIATEALK